MIEASSRARNYRGKNWCWTTRKSLQYVSYLLEENNCVGFYHLYLKKLQERSVKSQRNAGEKQNEWERSFLTFLWTIQDHVYFVKPGGGELPLSLCPGVGNRTPSEEKMANPRGCAFGGDGNSRNWTMHKEGGGGSDLNWTSSGCKVGNLWICRQPLSSD